METFNLNLYGVSEMSQQELIFTEGGTTVRKVLKAIRDFIVGFCDGIWDSI